MLEVATEVRTVEILSQDQATSISPRTAAATFRGYCWPPPNADRDEAGEPPNKRRRISADASQVSEEESSMRGDHVCLSKTRFKLVSTFIYY